jgi:ribose 1,5-bisphosphate isomerase
MGFKEIVRGIKEVRIQGAVNVAKSAVKAIVLLEEEHKLRNKDILLKALFQAKNILIKTRPTEPCMQNALNYLFIHLQDEPDISGAIKKRAEQVLNHFDDSLVKIAKIGSKKIMNKSIIFTHCHSNTVMAVFFEAKKLGKTFTVHNTETRPLFQGRITAQELARKQIPVTHFIDSAARLALKNADLMLIGADAITTEGKIINKIGSELFAEIAQKFDVPVYACADSWKFDPKTIFGYEEEIEKRNAREVWPAAPKGVIVSNLAFEKINPDFVAGVISEIGVYKPSVFIEEVKKVYPWIF